MSPAPDTPGAPAAPTAPTAIAAPPVVTGKAWVILDAGSGRILAGQNYNAKLEPASITKVMTSYVIAAELASAKLLLEADGVMLASEMDALSMPAEVESTLAMTLREAATNIHRHARARHARVSLRTEAAANRSVAMVAWAARACIAVRSVSEPRPVVTRRT